jgi:plastocyanin
MKAMMLGRLRTFVVPALALSAMLAAGHSRAQTPPPAAPESSNIEELRRENKALKAQVQALRTAISDAMEFDRLRTQAFNRALSAAMNGEAPPPPPKEALDSPRPTSTRAPSLSRRAPAEPVAGGVRGKVEVPDGEPVAYVFVENIRGPLVKGEKVKIEQVNKTFSPPWAVVQRGAVVEFPNMDNIYHNVFSVSPGNAFDLGLYNSGGDSQSHSFDEPGSVDIYCNIHPKMAASVLVVPNRYYAKVKSDGSYELSGVPAGRRKIVAWSPGSRMSADWVEVAPGAKAQLSLKLERKGEGHNNKTGRPYGQYE